MITHRHPVFLLAALALFSAACADDAAGPLAPEPASSSGKETAPLIVATAEPVPNSYIVVLKPGADPKSVASLAQVSPRFTYGTTSDATGAGQGISLSVAPAEGGGTTAGFAATLKPAELEALRRDQRVAYVEQDQYVTPEGHQTMDRYGDPWGLDRIDQRPSSLSGSYRADASGAGVYVYIVDSGIQTSHAEFEGRAKTVYNSYGGNNDDCTGHGTAVAGTIGGKTGGVAKKVNLRAVKFSGCSGSGTTSTLLSAIQWIQNNRTNPAVVNMSISTGYSQAVNDAVEKLIRSGVFVAAAAGNYNTDACRYSPASAPSVFTVAATDRSTSKASYSSYGKCIDSYAPGSDIWTAKKGGGLIYYTGTSMAAPHAAGVAALYLSSKNKSASPAEIDGWLKSQATRDAVRNNPSGTPNRILYMGGLNGGSTASTPSPSPLPSSWSAQSIGSVATPGSASYANGVYKVSGSGADIWGTADEFEFSYRKLSGDGEIVARVTAQSNTDSWAKSGVMLREGLSAGARHATVVVTPSNGVAMQYRAAEGQVTAHAGAGGRGAPTWVRLVRSGSTLTGYRSSDGESWTRIGSVSIKMKSDLYAGLAVTSHKDGVLSTASFANVKVDAAPAWQSRDVGAVAAHGSYGVQGSTFTVRGSGADIWNTSDEFRFVYRQLSGDGQITARVLSQSNTDPWAKAGVMIRDGLASNAKHATLVLTPGNGIAFQRRSGGAGATSLHTDGGLARAPVWVRLVRRGSTITAYRSANGSTWTKVGSASISMAQSVQVGLAVTAHRDGAVSTGTFDNVALEN